MFFLFFFIVFSIKIPLTIKKRGKHPSHALCAAFLVRFSDFFRKTATFLLGKGLSGLDALEGC